jgi:hypothetical protein
MASSPSSRVSADFRGNVCDLHHTRGFLGPELNLNSDHAVVGVAHPKVPLGLLRFSRLVLIVETADLLELRCGALEAISTRFAWLAAFATRVMARTLE